MQNHHCGLVVQFLKHWANQCSVLCTTTARKTQLLLFGLKQYLLCLSQPCNRETAVDSNCWYVLMIFFSLFHNKPVILAQPLFCYCLWQTWAWSSLTSVTILPRAKCITTSWCATWHRSTRTWSWWRTRCSRCRCLRSWVWLPRWASARPQSWSKPKRTYCV